MKRVQKLNSSPVCMCMLEASRREVAPFLMEPLLTCERLNGLTERALELPGEVAEYSLECALSPPALECVLLARLKRTVTEFTPRASEPSSTCSAEAFASSWVAGNAGRDSPCVWMEVDESARRTHFPNLHIRLNARVGIGKSGYCTGDAALEECRNARGLVRELGGNAVLSVSQVEVLERCIELLPAEAYPVHCSSLHTPTSGTRFCATLPCESFRAYALEICGPQWESKLETLWPWGDAGLNGPTVCCAISFGAQTVQALGIIFAHDQVRAGLDDPSRSKVRQRLMREGLCTLAQDAALSEWMNGALSAANHQHALQRRLELCVSRTLARLTSKAYLGVIPQS